MDAGLVAGQVITLFGFLILSIVISVIPFVVAKISKCKSFSNKMILLVCSFIAGTILGIVMMHMLPESGHRFERFFEVVYPAGNATDVDHSFHNSTTPVEEDNHEHKGYIASVQDYPWNYLVASVTILFFFTLDRLYYTKDEVAPPKPEKKEIELSTISSVEADTLAQQATTLEGLDGDLPQEIKNGDASTSQSTGTAEVTPSALVINTPKSEGREIWERLLFLYGTHCKQVLISSLLVLALSLYAFVEALHIGTATEAADFGVELVVVFTHRLFEALACGIIVQFINNPTPLKHMLSEQSPRTNIVATIFYWILSLVQIIFFSLSTSLGIALGLILKAVDFNSDGSVGYYLSTALAESFAAGALLFVVCFEFLPKIFSQFGDKWYWRLIHLLLMWFGFSFLVLSAMHG